jgi:hypothetical protein
MAPVPQSIPKNGLLGLRDPLCSIVGHEQPFESVTSLIGAAFLLNALADLCCRERIGRIYEQLPQFPGH